MDKAENRLSARDFTQSVQSLEPDREIVDILTENAMFQEATPNSNQPYIRIQQGSKNLIFAKRLSKCRIAGSLLIPKDQSNL